MRVMHFLNMGEFAGPQAVSNLYRTLVWMNESLFEGGGISFRKPFTFLFYLNFNTFLISFL